MHAPDDSAAMPERAPQAVPIASSRPCTMSKRSDDSRRQEPAQAATSAILVLGMHRSGTSAVAGLLHLAGAFLGHDSKLIPAQAQDNPNGYWERNDVVVAHDKALEASHFTWDRIAGFDPAKFDTHATSELMAQLRPIIAELSGSDSSWLAKDPRLCLLLPHWFALLDQPACVMVVRDPREIAASMHNGPRGAFTSPYVIALWEKYMRVALANLGGQRALFVSYSALLSDPHDQVDRLLAALRKMGVGDLHMPSKQALKQFLDPQLHRSVPAAHTYLSPSQQALYDWLQEQCAKPGEVTVGGFPVVSSVDDFLSEFEHTFDDYMEQGKHRAIQETRDQLADNQTRLQSQIQREEPWQKELVAQRQIAAQAQSELTALRSALAQAQQGTQIQQHLAMDAQKQLLAERELALQARHEAEMQRSRAQQLQQDSAAQFDATLQAQAEMSAQQHRAETIERHARGLEEAVAALRTSWSWRLTAPIRTLAGLLRWRGSVRTEQRLYRWFYSMPGLDSTRKRALIVWLHRHAPWLTYKTLSYRLYQQADQFERAYTPTYGANAPSESRMDQARADAIIGELKHSPMISVVMPVYNVDPRWLMHAVDSVRCQFYPHWELCIADDASTRRETVQALDELERERDRRIRIVRLKRNSGIALASNAAFKLAKGEYVGLLDHDDELTRDALLEVVRALNAHVADLIYSDEDKTDEANSPKNPFFKPDFSLEYFFSNNYLCHFTVLRTRILKKIGGFRQGVDGAQDFDLFLRFTEHTDRIAHIPKVLYHWRMISGSTAATASAKPYTWEAGRAALEHSLGNRGLRAKAELGPFPNTYRIHYDIIGDPLVSILIPFRDRPELLRVCVESILEKTHYQNYEILGIDNASVQSETLDLMRQLEQRDRRVRFVHFDKPFNYSAINNFGAHHARGTHLLLLNSDTEVLSAEWLEAMLEHSQRETVGVVGAKLLYPDNTIQHAGVVIDKKVIAMHPFQFTPSDHPGYAALPHLLHNVSAVTFACAMTRRSVFEQIGGLDEQNLAVCYNDIDYCLRAREAGYHVVYTPYAVLRHFESKSRGADESPEAQARFRSEFAYMQQRHARILSDGDPYYNPNLSLGVQGGYQPNPRYVDELPS